MDCKKIFSDQEVDSLCKAISQDCPLPPEEPALWLIGLCGGCKRHLEWSAPIVGQMVGQMAEALPCPKCGRYYFTARQDES